MGYRWNIGYKGVIRVIVVLVPIVRDGLDADLVRFIPYGEDVEGYA